jgi:hypothetical protein
MNWVRQVPAWIWLLFGAVQMLRIAATFYLGSSPSVIGIITSSVAGALFFGLAFCRWRFWSQAAGGT